MVSRPPCLRRRARRDGADGVVRVERRRRRRGLGRNRQPHARRRARRVRDLAAPRARNGGGGVPLRPRRRHANHVRLRRLVARPLGRARQVVAPARAARRRPHARDGQDRHAHRGALPLPPHGGRRGGRLDGAGGQACSLGGGPLVASGRRRFPRLRAVARRRAGGSGGVRNHRGRGGERQRGRRAGPHRVRGAGAARARDLRRHRQTSRPGGQRARGGRRRGGRR
mmetsp:Transcript_14621/g.46871  ORF Transcript_14621/g.46871 Transcript_14621/m.46871 type:complete len:226 (-) Transcript_14621:2-679(-)